MSSNLTMTDFILDDSGQTWGPPEPEQGDLSAHPWEQWQWEHLPPGPEYALAEQQHQKDCCPWMFPMLWMKRDWDNRTQVRANYNAHRMPGHPRG